MESTFRDDILFSRFITGDLSEAERRFLEKHPDYPTFRSMVESARQRQLPDTEIQAMWRRFIRGRSGRAHQRWLWAGIGVAAALTLTFFVWTLLQPMPATPAVSATATGETKTVSLPDGSSVRLNAVSSLEVVTNNWARERRVRLIGEGFFQIKKLPAPFVVETAAGSVFVLGTNFNVRYRGRAFEVACYTGLVQAGTNDGAKQALRAGQKTAAINGRWQPLASIIDSWPAWMQGDSRFSDAPVYEVFAELERQYDVRVRASGSENIRFSGTFTHRNLDQALRMVCEPLGFRYSIDGKKVLVERK